MDQLERESLLAKKRDELNLLVESVGKEIAALEETGEDTEAIESAKTDAFRAPRKSQKTN